MYSREAKVSDPIFILASNFASAVDHSYLNNYCLLCANRRATVQQVDSLI
jgi:hypothetical protein